LNFSYKFTTRKKETKIEKLKSKDGDKRLKLGGRQKIDRREGEA
jgi:hypothetical protein